MIPNEYHFIFLAPDSGGKPFSLIHYLAIASCYKVNRPAVINMYCDREPSGVWWDRARHMLNVVLIQAPDEIFGNPLVHPAHKSDVLRLQILIEKGGIYLDVDVLCLRPFAPLRKYAMVLGEELGAGLCNAVVLAKPGAGFLKRWLAEYKTFSSAEWNLHSVKTPARLAHQRPKEIHVLGYRRFFSPTCRREDLRAFFFHTGSQFCGDSFCVHLWESATWPYVGRLVPADLWLTGSEFCLRARTYLDPAWVESDEIFRGSQSTFASKDIEMMPARIEALSPAVREATILCGVQGVPLKEAAWVMGCPEEAVSEYFEAGLSIMCPETIAGTSVASHAAFQ